MSDCVRKVLGWLSLAGCLFMGWPEIPFPHRSDMNVWAASRTGNKGGEVKGNAEAGRMVFNGKGVCHYCHGIDGYRDKRPELESDTAALIAQLNPPPADLRNPKGLHLTTDKQRAQAIRKGHPGTGMFPDTTMTDQQLADTLAYLALLRSEGSVKQ